MKRARRTFTAAYKADAVSLVQEQGYTVPQACQALGLGETALRRWVRQVKREHVGFTPAGQAITPEQQRIQTLEAQVKRLEMEKAILKKRRRSWPRPARSLYADQAMEWPLSRGHALCRPRDPTK